MPQTVNLPLVCKELRNLLDDPTFPAESKLEAKRCFKKALYEKLDFPKEVFLWDDTAVDMYLEIIISAS